jgi:hypothetical protein
MRIKVTLAGILCLLVIWGGSPYAVTIGEALAAEQVLKSIDALPPAERDAFIQKNRAQLNAALSIREIIRAISQTVLVTSRAADRVYHHPVICPLIDATPDDDDAPKSKAPPVDQAELSAMADDFKSDLRRALNLPDTAATSQYLEKIDVTEMIVNRLIEEQRCKL